MNHFDNFWEVGAYCFWNHRLPPIPPTSDCLKYEVGAFCFLEPPIATDFHRFPRIPTPPIATDTHRLPPSRWYRCILSISLQIYSFSFKWMFVNSKRVDLQAIINTRVFSFFSRTKSNIKFFSVHRRI